MGGSQTAGESYNEFSFVEEDPVVCLPHVYPPYPSSPEEDWPALLYNVTIERSWEPYVRGYITTQVLLNIIGFSAFWLPPSCGERMGLSITAMLAAVAAEIVVAANLPAAAEYTWFQKFSILSMSFAFVSLMECVAVLYFYYKRSEDMIPWWFTEFRKWYGFRQARKRAAQVVTGTKQTVVRGVDNVVDSVAKVRKSYSGEYTGDHAKNMKRHDPKCDDADSFSENDNDDGKNNAPQEDSSFASFEEENRDKLGLSETERDRDKHGHSEMSIDIAKELEAEQKKADANGVEISDGDFGEILAGSALTQSLVSRLSFDGMEDSNDKLLKDLQPTKRQAARRGHASARGESRRVSFTFETDSPEPESQEHPPFVSTQPKPTARRLSLEETPMGSRGDMMKSFRTDAESFRSLVVPRDADDFHDVDEIEHNRKWKNIAARIDDVARFWIPMAFAISLAIVLSQAFGS